MELTVSKGVKRPLAVTTTRETTRPVTKTSNKLQLRRPFQWHHKKYEARQISSVIQAKIDNNGLHDEIMKCLDCVIGETIFQIHYLVVRRSDLRHLPESCIKIHVCIVKEVQNSSGSNTDTVSSSLYCVF